MRIIAGKYKGRKLLEYDEEYIRPYTDRIKESVFAALESKLYQAKVLDLYAGSGSIGLEAISRGAAFVTFNDLSSKALSLIKKNAEKIGVPREQYSLVKSDDISFLEKNQLNFDIIFMDPPFGYDNWENLWRTITDVYRNGVSPLFVFRHEKKNKVKIPEDFTIIRSKKYGKSIVDFMELNGKSG